MGGYSIFLYRNYPKILDCTSNIKIIFCIQIYFTVYVSIYTTVSIHDMYSDYLLLDAIKKHSPKIFYVFKKINIEFWATSFKKYMYFSECK